MSIDSNARFMRVLSDIVGLHAGLVATLTTAQHTGIFWDGVHLATGQTGDLLQLHPNTSYAGNLGNLRLIGAGCDLDPEVAKLKAVMETLERYATAVVSDDEVIISSAEALGMRAMNWASFPGLYVRQEVESSWKIYSFDPNQQMRWVKGFNISANREVYVPLIATRIHLAASEAEAFMPQSTAGVAAHFNFESAILSALCEVIERDAIETIWALRLPLRRLSVKDVRDPRLQMLIDRDENGLINQAYYDASNEFGLPIIYAIRDTKLPIGNDVIVTCSCHHDPETAILKARLDASGQQIMRVNDAQGFPYTRYNKESGHLARDHMAERPDLSFLRNAHTEAIYEPAVVQGLAADTSGESEKLCYLLNTLSSHGHEVVVVDLTTSELRKFGVCVVKILIPTLLTVPPSENQRFLQHPRLLQKLAAAGSKGRVNMAPQPFC